MQELINLIANVGFPIVIATYVIVRLEGTVRKNTDAINNLVLQLKCANSS